MLAKRPFIAVMMCAVVNVPCTYAEKPNFADFKEKYKAKFEKYSLDYSQKYQAYKKDLIEKWGVAELSSNTEYVSYSEDKQVKVIADFENDTIEVSLRTDDSNIHSSTEQNDVIRAAIVDALSVSPDGASASNLEFALTGETEEKAVSGKDNAPTILQFMGIDDSPAITSLVEQADEVPQYEQLKQVKLRTTERLNEQISEVEQFVEREETSTASKVVAKRHLQELNEQLKSLNVKRTKVTEKNIKTYKIQLKRDRFKKAEKFLDTVKIQAKRWNIPEDVLLAVMETESHFNPMAKSHIPAYGLMQIVPATAGADVNQRVFALSQKPSPKLLYNGDKNIEYGSAYFNILLTVYLKEVSNPTSRLYCAIAAYNTGIGNLAKAFNKGEKGRKKAIRTINSLTPEQVANVIKKYTHVETQRYLKKVLKSKAYFAQHI